MDLDDEELEATKKLNGTYAREECIAKIFFTDGKDMEFYDSKKQAEQLIDAIKSGGNFVEVRVSNQRRVFLNIDEITSCEIIPERRLDDE